MPRTVRSGETRGNRGALRVYLDTISDYGLLTESGEHRLALSGREGSNDARRRLAEGNLRLVLKIALDYRHSGLNLDDLIAEGNVGLTEATRRFDPDRGVRFGCYAAWWIRKRIIAAIHHSASQRLSPGARPTDGGKTPAQGQARRYPIVSLEDLLTQSGETRLVDVIADVDAEAPDDLALQHELTQTIRSVVAKLPRVEKEILERHYGLNGAPPSTLRRIGAQLGLSRERVRQIEKLAIERVRRLIGISRSHEP